jgi:4-hydroxy-tetrahydrodipicolinate synthase
MKAINLSGSISALPTPFHGHTLDLDTFQSLVKRAEEAAAGGVVAGSTGEGASLDIDEYHQRVGLAKETASGSLQVIAGVGSPTTHKAVQLAEQAASAGADALLVCTPYYTNASEAGICRHIETIAETAALPIVIYNVPSRTGFNISVEAVLRLRHGGVIMRMKEAGSNIARVPQLLAETDPGFCLLAGDDHSAYAMRIAGGRGCVSVVANVVPDLCVRAQRLCDKGSFADRDVTPSAA